MACLYIRFCEVKNVVYEKNQSKKNRNIKR